MLLNDAERDKYFHVANGTVICSVWELEPALAGMGEDTFRYHVNQDKNDFASWAKGVLDDAQLSEGIAAAADKKDMQLAVLRRLVNVLKV